MKGMLLDVYKHGKYDCTNGGVTSKTDTVLLVGKGIPEIFEESDDRPVVYLKEHMGDYIAVPDLERSGSMFGGNFIWTSDSRFRRICPAPIRVHDRYEW